MVTRKLSTVTRPRTITLVDLLPIAGGAGKGIVQSSPASAKLFAIARRSTFIPGNHVLLVKAQDITPGSLGGESCDAQKRKLVMYGKKEVCDDDVGTSEGDWFHLLLSYRRARTTTVHVGTHGKETTCFYNFMLALASHQG
jgi:hypothetical protein